MTAALLAFLSLFLPWYTIRFGFHAAERIVNIDVFPWGASGPHGTMTWVGLAIQTGLVEWMIAVVLLGPVLSGGILSLVAAFFGKRRIVVLGGILILLGTLISLIAVEWVLRRGLWAGTAGSVLMILKTGFFVAGSGGLIGIVGSILNQRRTIQQKESRSRLRPNGLDQRIGLRQADPVLLAEPLFVAQGEDQIGRNIVEILQEGISKCKFEGVRGI